MLDVKAPVHELLDADVAGPPARLADDAHVHARFHFLVEQPQHLRIRQV